MNRRRLMIAVFLVLMAATLSHWTTAFSSFSDSSESAPGPIADVVCTLDECTPIAVAVPLLILGIAMGLVLGLILGVKIHPFITLVMVAMVVSALVGSWMNDSGFWIFAKMSGLTEVEALKSWTIMLLVLATSSLLATIVLALLFPFPLT